MSLLTWCHRNPADTPTSPCSTAISNEPELDNVACACYVSRQGVATAFFHQGCPIAVCDCQVVVATGGMGFDVIRSELQRQDQSLLHLYRFSVLKVIWIVVGVVW